MTMRPRSILETVLYCPDLDAARAFYTGVLGLELAAATERHVFLRCGDGMLLLFDPEHTSRIAVPIGDAVVPMHGGRGQGHMAFRASREEIDRWWTALLTRCEGFVDDFTPSSVGCESLRRMNSSGSSSGSKASWRSGKEPSSRWSSSSICRSLNATRRFVSCIGGDECVCIENLLARASGRASSRVRALMCQCRGFAIRPPDY